MGLGGLIPAAAPAWAAIPCKPLGKGRTATPHLSHSEGPEPPPISSTSITSHNISSSLSPPLSCSPSSSIPPTSPQTFSVPPTPFTPKLEGGGRAAPQVLTPQVTFAPPSSGRRAPAVAAGSPLSSRWAPRAVTELLFGRAPPLRSHTSLRRAGVKCFMQDLHKQLDSCCSPPQQRGGYRGRVRCSGRCSPAAGRTGMPGGSGVRWPGMLRSLLATG